MNDNTKSERMIDQAAIDHAAEAAKLREFLPLAVRVSLDNPSIGTGAIAYAVKGKTGQAIRKAAIRKARAGDPDGLRELAARFGYKAGA